MRKLKFRYWIIGAVLSLVALVYGLVQWSASRTFARHEADVAAKIAEIRARSHEREPLFDNPLPGNAWDLYVKALTTIGNLSDSERQTIFSFTEAEAPFPTTAEIEPIWEKCAPEVALLRQALRMKEVWPAYDYEDAGELQLPMVRCSLYTTRLLKAGAALHHAQDRDSEAMDALVLGFGTAHDTARHGMVIHQVINTMSEALCLAGWRNILLNHSLRAGDLERLAGALDRLERTRPAMKESFPVDDFLVRTLLPSLDPWKNHYDSFASGKSLSPIPSPRYLFSHRLACAAAMDSCRQLSHELEAVARLPIHERYDAGEKLVERYRDIKNEWVTLFLPDAGMFHKEAIARLQWSLMRTATALAWYEAEKGAMPAKLEDLVPRYLPAVPTCPLTGKPLGYSPGKVWSCGFDGDDDGGKALTEEEETAEKGDGDIVWTVQQKK